MAKWPSRPARYALHRYCQVAIDTPLRRLFDYRLSDDAAAPPGVRVRVPFGRQRMVGVVVSHSETTDVPEGKLRAVEAVLDAAPLLSGADLELLQWAADYYHHPVGQVFATALPRTLREGLDREPMQRCWEATASGHTALADDALRRTPGKRALLAHVAAHAGCDDAALDAAFDSWRPHARALVERKLLQSRQQPIHAAAKPSGGPDAESGARPVLTSAQQRAVEQLTPQDLQGAFLLDGVTGSGKTEVYLRVVSEVLKRGRAALILCPEIGLTPQLLERFEQRFATPVAALHSGLTDSERARAWRAAATARRAS